MSLIKRGNIWHYSIMDAQGVRQRGSTGETDKRKAQKKHDDLRHEFSKTRARGFTLDQALKVWLDHATRTDREKSAIRVLIRNYEDRAVDEVTQKSIFDALAGRAVSTVNRTINIVNAAIALSHEQKQCPLIKIKRKDSGPTRLRFLTHEEWETLKAHLQPHVLAIITFALETGLRRTNVMQLKWRYVDQNNKLVWVDAVDAKGRVTIPVPLSKTACEIIKQQEGKNKEFVFTYDGEHIDSVRTSWKKSLVKAGIDVVTEKDAEGNEIAKSLFRFHDLRHTWASWHVQRGTPLKVLKELGGWKSLDMVERYAHLDPKHLRQWVDNEE